MTPEQFKALTSQNETILANQATHSLEMKDVRAQVARLSDRVHTLESESDTSKHEFKATDTAMAQIIDAQKAEADRRHAETTAQLIELRKEGSSAPVIRELRIGFTALGVLAAVVYLLAQRVITLTPEQAAGVGTVLAGAVAVFVKASSDKTKAEKKLAGTIPPPKGDA